MNPAITGRDDNAGMASSSKRNAARERAAAARAAQHKAERRRRTVVWSAAAGVVAVIVAVVVLIAVTSGGGGGGSGSTKAGGLGPEGIPLEQGTVLAAATGAAGGQTVDGIKCESSEQVAYHIHAHLAVYVNGSLRPVPLGIGIVKPEVQQTTSGGFASATNCYYWLHTHVQDGIVHIESPTKQVYTLGQFFDEWHQPLSASQVATASGAVTAYVNGKKYAGDPRAITLTPHAVIQLDVGSPAVAPRAVNWSTSQL
jgi:hypothetical protein